METLIQAIEIFAFVTGVPYIILEVLQKNTMWYFGIATGIACAFSFAVQHLWASMGLNIYYVGMSLWGLWQWKKDAEIMSEAQDASAGEVHLNHSSVKTIIWSAVIFIVGTAVLIALLRLLNDKESDMDAVVTVISAIAMFWLGKSYLPHWLIWIVADTLLTVLCFATGLYWMAGLYCFYIISAVIGFFHWRNRGIYVS